METRETAQSLHRRLAVTQEAFYPSYVVWELTLACDQPCTHCGSRAGTARSNELTLEQCLAVVPSLVKLGTRDVALIGGEAYLHPGFLDILRALKAAGLRPAMTTGGRGIDTTLAREMASSGLGMVSVSLDGLEPTHDLMRAARGSFRAARGALKALREAGILIGANTNLNRLNHPDLEALYEVLREEGVKTWQVQLTAPLGRAADRADMILQPWDLLTLMPRITALKQRAFSDGVLLMPGNNLGYFAVDEALLRSQTPTGRDHFGGCQAGRFVLGIESDGGVKGCPSLQSKPYVAGRVPAQSLEALWQHDATIGFARARTVEDLWGFCKTCPFAEVCLGGCTFTAHALLGRAGNNPYCAFRAKHFAQRGLRERLVPVERAPGEPFDHGRFELVQEALDAEDPGQGPPERLVQIRRAGRP